MSRRFMCLLSISTGTALMASAAPALALSASTTASASTSAGTADTGSAGRLAEPTAAVSQAAPDRRPLEADGELPALRTATTRTFSLARGALRTRLYDRPVNFLDEDGLWHKTDTTVVADDTGGGVNKAGPYQLSLPGQLKARPVIIRAGRDSVGFTLAGADARLTRQASSGVYEDALPGVDLVYEAQDEGVKETLVLQAATAPTSYTFTTSLSAGLRMVQTPDGGLAAVDQTGKARMSFAPPSVEDSSGKPAGLSTEATSLRLSGPADAPELTLSVDADWLRSPDRVFPVNLDPSYRLFATAQTHVSSGAPTTNFSAATTLRVGTDTSGARNNTLLKFDVAANVARDVEVIGARLTTAVTNADANAAGTAVHVKPLTRAWTPTGATWNTSDDTSAWATPGGDTDAIAASTTFTAGATSMNFNLLALATDWVTGARTNHGLQLSTASTTAGSSLQLAKDGLNRKTWLDIDYIARTGDLPHYTYTSKRLTDRSELKVNIATGNLLLANADLDIASPGPAQSVRRYFNSRDVQLNSGFHRSLPGGWTVYPDDEFLAAVDGGYVHTAPTGAAFFWRQNPDGSLRTPAGAGADLTRDTATGVFHLTDRSSGTVKTFSQSGFLSSVKDRNGNLLDLSTAPLTDAAGRTTQRTYSGEECVDPKLKSITDNSGRSVQYEPDPFCTHTLNSFTDAEGKTTSYLSDAYGKLEQITTPAGRRTLIRYGDWGRVSSITQVTDTTTNTGPTTYYAYGATGGGDGKTVVTDPNGNTTTYFYDSASRATKVTDALGRSRSKTYNADNSVTTAVDALSASSTYDFDTDFRATGSATPGGARSTLRYAEPAGPVTSRVGHWQPSGSVDANGSDTSYTYDGPGNLKTSSTAPTGAVTAAFTYNPPAGSPAACGGKPGQLCSSTDGNLNTTRYTYNAAGDLTGVDNPAPLGDTSSTYDSLGRITSSTDGKGQTTRTSYDRLDRVTQVLYGGATACDSATVTAGNCLRYTYDADGLQTSQSDQTGTTAYGYDSLGRQTSKTLPGQAAQTLTYDPAGNLTSATDAGGTTTYRYDAANQLTHLAEPGGSCTTTPTVRCTTFGYNSNGVRTSTTYPTATPTTMTVTPDTSGRVQRIRSTTGTATHADFSYGYTDAAGGDTALTRSRTDHLAGLTTAYGYDSLNRLTAATERNSAGSTTAAWAYAYDRAGNRTSASLTGTPGAAATTFGYNAANQIVSRNGNTAGWAYDANGNETAAVGATTRTSTWNSKNQLTSLSSGGSTTPFAYTGASQDERTSRGQTTFTTSPTGLATETTSGVVTNFVRDPGGTLIALRTAAGSFYYLYDGLGSVVGLVNSTGTQVNSYSYDPYGISRAKTEQVANQFQYTGGYLDSATGLYKLGIRYYDPTLGRFTQLDPAGQDPHYTYAGNDPVNVVDPTGGASLIKVLISFADKLLSLSSTLKFVRAIAEGRVRAASVILASEVFGAITTALCFGIATAGATVTAGSSLLAAIVCIGAGQAVAGAVARAADSYGIPT